MKEINKPTEGEIAILNVLWEKGEASVRTVFEEISLTKESGYTTTLKLMQIMLEKGLVTRDDSARTHIYKAAINREKTQKQIVHKMIAGLFAGSSAQLVMQALGDQTPDEAELAEIESYIKQLKSK